jgi:hypothetical protein
MADDVTKLRTLVDTDDGHQEKQCQPYLERIKDDLALGTSGVVSVCSREEPSRAGHCDFVVVARDELHPGIWKSTIFIWEAKAPQSYIMKRITNTRLCPSPDLVEAESQLITYTRELDTNENLRDSLGIIDRLVEVRPAGIIIGRRDRLVRPNKELKDLPGGPTALRLAYEEAMGIRRHYLYAKSDIVVRTWDWVLDQLRKRPASGPALLGQ